MCVAQFVLYNYLVFFLLSIIYYSLPYRMFFLPQFVELSHVHVYIISLCIIYNIRVSVVYYYSNIQHVHYIHVYLQLQGTYM